MDYSAPVILKVATPEYKKVVIETSNAIRYYSDLSSMAKVYGQSILLSKKQIRMESGQPG